jgi:hypothetical protein
MSKRNYDRYMSYLDELGPEYPEALVNLIDAMRVFIRVDLDLAKELLREGQITREQYDAGVAENAPLVAWLKKSEEHGIDPSLHGTIRDAKQ